MDKREILKKVDHTLLTQTATWEEIKRPDSREIIFLDNNVLASNHRLEQIDRMGGEP